MTQENNLEKVLVLESELWREGPPHKLFREMRSKCPVHWTERITDYPFEAGFWSVTKAEDAQTVCRDWQTFSSEKGGFTALTVGFAAEITKAMFIGMDPPRHDHLKALFQTAFTPKRVAHHEDAIRAIVTKTLDRAALLEECDLVSDVATPVASRVIGSFMGIPEEDDEIWATLVKSTFALGDKELNPKGLQGLAEHEIPEIFNHCQQLIADRREQPTDDLTSVLVHAEIDGKKLEENEIIMGFFLLMGAGNDSTKSTYCSGMRALMEHPEQYQLLVDDPSLTATAIEESLRMFPPFPHFRRTATCDTTIRGQEIKEGDKVVIWFASSNRDEDLYEDPDRFDIRRNPEHQAFGGGGRHYCLGAALARLQLKVLFEETLTRFPKMTLAGEPKVAESAFISQLKTLPVRMTP
jgi:cytochrome P450